MKPTRLFLLLAATAIFPAAAWAHAKPVKLDPADQATVAAPHKVSIEFSEGLEAKLSSIHVLNAYGKQVNTQPSVVDVSDKKKMSVQLPAITSGMYSVKWNAVAEDGHKTKGEYMFMVK